MKQIQPRMLIAIRQLYSCATYTGRKELLPKHRTFISSANMPSFFSSAVWAAVLVSLTLLLYQIDYDFHLQRSDIFTYAKVKLPLIHNAQWFTSLPKTMVQLFNTIVQYSTRSTGQVKTTLPFMVSQHHCLSMATDKIMDWILQANRVGSKIKLAILNQYHSDPKLQILLQYSRPLIAVIEPVLITADIVGRLSLLVRLILWLRKGRGTPLVPSRPEESNNAQTRITLLEQDPDPELIRPDYRAFSAPPSFRSDSLPMTSTTRRYN